MKAKKGSTIHVIDSASNFKYMLILEGLATGLVAGVIAVIYRIILGYAEEFVSFVSNTLQQHAIYILGWFVVLIIIGVIVSRLLKYEPLISGSGIPQVEGEMMSFIDQKWYKVLLAKITGGVLCAFGGLL